MDLEICNVNKILAKRIDKKGYTEYLVSWVEYPGEDTWECLENLKNVKDKIQEFDEKLRKKCIDYKEQLTL